MLFLCQKLRFATRGEKNTVHAYFENRENVPFVSTTTHGMTFPLHLHPQLELFFGLEGETRVTVRDKTELITPGTLVVIAPNQMHSYESQSETSRAALVICDLSLVGGYADILLREHPERPFLPPERLHPNVGFALGALMAESREGREERAVLAPLVQLLLARVLPQLLLTRNRSADFKELTYQIAQYTASHFSEPMTLGALARELGVSRYHLSHVFSEKIGQSFPSYLTSLRLDAACGLLRETGRTVTEIAADCGFESQRTFFRAFKARYDTTPAAFRRDEK